MKRLELCVQGQSKSSELHWMFINSIFSIPLTSATKLVCWCTITNNNLTEFKPSGHILIVAMWCTILLGTQQGIFCQNDKDINLFIVVWLYGWVVGGLYADIQFHIYIYHFTMLKTRGGQWNWLHIHIIVTSGESWCAVLKHCCLVSVNCFQLHARILRKGNTVREDWMTYPEYETDCCFSVS